MSEHPTIDELFYQHLAAEDELGIVVRAHIHIEASLNDFIDAIIPFPDQLPRFQYEARLRLACALGLRQDHFEALKLLGDIRNAFSHKLTAKLTSAMIDQLYSKLPPDTQSFAVQIYEVINRKRTETGPEFDRLPPKDRFVLISVILKSFVAVEAHKALATDQ